jgi:hypothetical protein
MGKTITDVMLTHTILANTITLQNIILEKDMEIDRLKKELKRLETLLDTESENKS